MQFLSPQLGHRPVDVSHAPVSQVLVSAGLATSPAVSPSPIRPYDTGLNPLRPSCPKVPCSNPSFAYAGPATSSAHAINLPNFSTQLHD